MCVGKKGRNGEWKEKEEQKIKKICFVTACGFFLYNVGSPSARRGRYASERKKAQVLTRWWVSLCSGRGECAVATACSGMSRIARSQDANCSATRSIRFSL